MRIEAGMRQRETERECKSQKRMNNSNNNNKRNAHLCVNLCFHPIWLVLSVFSSLSHSLTHSLLGFSLSLVVRILHVAIASVCGFVYFVFCKSVLMCMCVCDFVCAVHADSPSKCGFGVHFKSDFNCCLAAIESSMYQFCKCARILLQCNSFGGGDNDNDDDDSRRAATNKCSWTNFSVMQSKASERERREKTTQQATNVSANFMECQLV